MSTLIDPDTNKIINNVVYIVTEDYLRYKRDKENKKLCKSDDNFIFITYKACKQLNIDDSIFTQSDIARIVYIASYSANKNKLMITERTPMTKNRLFDLMNLDAKFFNRFYKKLIKNNVLIEKEENLYFNEKIMFFGKIKNHQYNVIRAYKDSIQRLYKSVSAKQHKRLSILYMLIPYINIKYNIICKNPFEADKNRVKPITLEELSSIFKYNLKSFIVLVDFLSDLLDKNNNPVIKQVLNTKNKKDNTIIVNPRVIYGGNDISDVAAYFPIFNR